jgi:hypothetical protein
MSHKHCFCEIKSKENFKHLTKLSREKLSDQNSKHEDNFKPLNIPTQNFLQLWSTEQNLTRAILTWPSPAICVCSLEEYICRRAELFNFKKFFDNENWWQSDNRFETCVNTDGWK